VNLFDVAAILLLVLTFVAGLRSGAIPQLGGLGGAALGLIAGLTLLPLVQPWLADLDPLVRAIAVLVGLLVMVAIGEVVGAAIGRTLAGALGDGIFGALDDVAGGAVGLLQGILVVWLVGGLIAIGPFPRFAAAAQNSTVLRTIEAVLPAPAEVAGDVAALLDDTTLPDLFVGLEPLPAPPVERPGDPEAAAIGALGEASTVKITSAACSRSLTGSGVVVAPDYVVTNAHVVAGGRTTRVSVGGRVVDAVPVLFDPNLDVAVLRAPGLGAPALRFAASDPPRGTSGAALGYPGGDALAIIPAAVARELDAVGRDIYDRRLVTRPVLELRAEIEQGDSGGPVMLADGTVGGLIFAEARSDPDVGYALTPTAVATAIGPAIGRTARVDTGPCL
jgi:S1-C subfamily serine protease